MKHKLVPVVICVLIFLAGWWIYNGQQKEVSKKIQWSLEDETGKVVPLFSLHYRWNGTEEDEPTWLIFPKEGKWWVVDLRDLRPILVEANSKTDAYKEIQKHKHEFKFEWIDNREFQPKASRYEALMTAIGFNMLFTNERNAFSDLLKDTKDFDEGRLQPEKEDISETEHQEYSLLANESVDKFNSFLDARCKQFPVGAERERCLVDASKEWLNTEGKKYEAIPSQYISGNGLALNFIEKGKNRR